MDQIFIVLEKSGYPRFQKLDLTREPAPIDPNLIEQMFKKANRCDRSDLTTWLPNYFDDVPIGQATYAIRWMLYSALRRFSGSDHPMADAWKELAPDAIKIIEFVMDIRKGEWTDEEIDKRMRDINNRMAEIKKAQEQGDWFAKTVTASTIMDVQAFALRFKSLQNYVDTITGQRPITLRGLE